MISGKFFRRLTAGAVVLAVSGAAAAVTTVAAGAAPGDGTLTLVPASGTDQSVFTATTSGPCPADGNTDGYDVEIQGPGTFTGVLSGNSSAGFSNTAPFNAQFAQSMAVFASSTNQTIVAGKYTIVLRCVDDLNNESARFTGSITFSDPTHYTVDTNASPGPSQSPGPSPTTTTTTPTTTATTTPTTTTTTTSASQTTTTTPSTTTPTTSDSDTTTQTSTNDIGVPSTTSDSSAGTQSTGATGTLANTGGPIGLTFMGGLILLAVGLAVVVWFQRPRKLALGREDHAARESETNVSDDR